MATVVPVAVAIKSLTPVQQVEWPAVLNAGDGTPINVADYDDITAAFYGTFGAGGSVSLMGSNDNPAAGALPTNWFALTAVGGVSALTNTAAGMKKANENPLWIKPMVTAGDGTTSIDCIVLLRRRNLMRY